MEQARYWIWTNRKHVFASQNASSNNSSPPSYGDSWEEQAFAEDAAGSACVWPPRSYSCSFCRREFKSAQALGGHMNVHRRDRARLKQSPGQHDAVNNLPPMMASYNHTSSPSPVRVSSSPPLPEKMELGLTTHPFFSTVLSENYSARPRSNLVADKCFHHVRDLTASAKSNEQEYVKTDLSTLNLLFSPTHDESEDHDGEIPRCNKRRRIDYEASSPDNFLWKSSDSDHVQGRYKRFQPDHVPPKLMSGAGELDLELRLGDPPKV